MQASQIAERAARESYGRLVALLASKSGDLAESQDALGEAFVAALESWPHAGVPTNPDAWLFAAARRTLIDRYRHVAVRDAAVPDLQWLDELHAVDPSEPITFPDERLKLLFVCAHPAIAAEARAPLMLQTVLGLTAERIASAFLFSPKTLGQRLWRAKQKIKAARIPFDIPEASQLRERTADVLEAIYAAYGTGWDDVAGADEGSRDLTEEAIWLARVLVQLLPTEPEARGLLALMLYCESRRDARRDADGCYVPLSEQDTTRWQRALIVEAEATLNAAAQWRQFGPYQIEAAIQSAHAQRAISGRMDWQAVAQLYAGLVGLTGSLGAEVAHAAALAEATGAGAGLAALDALPTERIESYQPYWALRAHLLRRSGDATGATVATTRAIGLTEDPAVRAWLASR
ncbi:MAG: DUF6596 domain-containing protein [Pseudomonadota bacterium]